MSDEDETADPHLVKAWPAKHFFVSMLIRDIELMPAIVDLVDNSADGAKRLRPEPAEDRYDGLWVSLTVTPERFCIEDNCGGMDIDLARDYAFRFGRHEDAEGPVGEVGQFGIGMKRALFKLGSKFEVTSSAASSRFVLPVSVPAWLAEKESDWTFRFSSFEEDVQVPDDERGTKIEVTDLHELPSEDFGTERFVQRLRRQIAMREMRLIHQGLRITVNDVELTVEAPILLASQDFAPIHVEKQLLPEKGNLVMKLWAGLSESTGDEDDVDDGEKYRTVVPAGWYVFCNDRLLLWADKSPLTGWGRSAAAYHPQFARFRGYVLLEGDSELMPWNTAKTGVDQDSRAFRAVQDQMFDALQKVQAVINRLKGERRRSEDAQPAVQALASARPTPLAELKATPAFVIPAEAPDPPRTAQWIRYQVDADDFDRVAKTIGTDASPADVGRATFDWYLESQVD